MLCFITGNQNKLKEVREVFPLVEHLDIDLPEIQAIDAHEIIKSKLTAALEHTNGELIVEDTSLHLDCLNGLPGPLIRWFLETIGNDGLADIAEKFGNNGAQAKTIIGYAKNRQEIHFFEGIINGQIVKPRGETTFGWNPIFLPDGYSQTFAEMDSDQRSYINMRRLALNQLKDFLQTN